MQYSMQYSMAYDNSFTGVDYLTSPDERCEQRSDVGLPLTEARLWAFNSRCGEEDGHLLHYHAFDERTASLYGDEACLNMELLECLDCGPVRCQDSEAPTGGSTDTQGRQGWQGWPQACNTIPHAVPMQKTTVKFERHPRTWDLHCMTHFLASLGLLSEIDFLYTPMDVRSKRGFGYSFVNFTSPGVALRAFELAGLALPQGKVLEVCWSSYQGLEVHVERYRNSPVMHESIAGAWRPATFAGGRRVPFPPPTRPIKQMKSQRKKGQPKASKELGPV